MDKEEIDRRISEMLAKRAARRDATVPTATEDRAREFHSLESFRHAAARIAQFMDSVAASLTSGQIDARVVYYDGGEEKQSARNADRVFLYVNVGSRGHPAPGGRPDFEAWSEIGFVCNPKEAAALVQVSFATKHLQYKGVAKRIPLGELPVTGQQEIMAFIGSLLEQD